MPNTTSATTIGMNVLVIDDQRLSRDVLSEALRPLGCSIHQAANADEALSELRLRRYPLMFIDLMMPGMDGYALARQIRRLEKENKLSPAALIAYSGSLYAENGALVDMEKERLRESGFDDGIVKPLSMESLQRVIDGTFPSGLQGTAPLPQPPAVEEEEAKPQATEAAPAKPLYLPPTYDLPTPATFMRALIVDDDRFMLATAEVHLKACLGHVHTARDADEALKLFCEEPFDLVLLDLEMPGMNGYALAKAMRGLEAGRQHRTCLVALSGNLSNGETIIKCAAHGMDDCLTKPFNAKLFRMRLELWQKGHYPARRLAKS